MKVYLAERNLSYEGFVVLGAFTTREAAQAACDKDLRPADFPFEPSTPWGDSYSIEELDLDEVKADQL